MAISTFSRCFIDWTMHKFAIFWSCQKAKKKKKYKNVLLGNVHRNLNCTVKPLLITLYFHRIVHSVAQVKCYNVGLNSISWQTNSVQTQNNTYFKYDLDWHFKSQRLVNDFPHVKFSDVSQCQWCFNIGISILLSLTKYMTWLS